MPDEEGNFTEEELRRMSPEELLALQKQNCVFCRIASKQIPATEIYADDDVVCVLDINPAAKGHVLVMPREHYQILPQVPQKTMAKLFLACQHVSQALLKGIQVEGTSIFVANGQVAGQRAPHFLMHVIPRDSSDGLLPGDAKQVPADQLSQMRRALTLNLDRLIKGNQLKVPKPSPAAAPVSSSGPSPAPAPVPAAVPLKVPAPIHAASRESLPEPLLQPSPETTPDSDADAPSAKALPRRSASPASLPSAPAPAAEPADAAPAEEFENPESEDDPSAVEDADEDDEDENEEQPPEPPAPSRSAPSAAGSPPASSKADLDAIAALFTGGKK